MKFNLSLALLLASSAVACTTDSSTTPDNTSDVSSDLSKANGGLDTTDEAPMFGDQASFEAMALEADAATADAFATDPTVTSIAASSTVDSRRVLVLWGKLPADRDATESRNWDGSLTISRGALVVSRTVGFEANDHLLPRLTKEVVSFDSTTRPYVDGLVLRVLNPDLANPAPLTLTYTSTIGVNTDQTPITYQFDLMQLGAGPIVIDAGDGFKMIAVSLDDAACHHGFMRGRWHRIAANMGVYRGVVSDAAGLPIGHVRGIYGERANGDKVMFGKFIALDGTFTGLINGTYGDGEYAARWIDRSGDHGTLHGHYFESTNETGGGFIGRWAESTCSEEPSVPPLAP